MVEMLMLQMSRLEFHVSSQQGPCRRAWMEWGRCGREMASARVGKDVLTTPDSHAGDRRIELQNIDRLGEMLGEASFKAQGDIVHGPKPAQRDARGGITSFQVAH